MSHEKQEIKKFCEKKSISYFKFSLNFQLEKNH